VARFEEVHDQGVPNRCNGSSSNYGLNRLRRGPLH
jgi:hypothetical protein